MAVARNIANLSAARRAPHRRMGPLALLAACCVALRASSLAFAGPAVLDRPAAKDRRAAGAARAAEGPEDAEKRDENDARAGRNQTQHPTEALRWSSGEDKPVALNPRWATCFVRSEAEGRSVLEEWQLRGERENVEAFRSWRKTTAAGQVNVRCVESTQTADDDVVCLECLTAAVAYSSGYVATLGAPITTTFVDAQQCVGSVVGGTGFCKSGQVTA